MKISLSFYAACSLLFLAAACRVDEDDPKVSFDYPRTFVLTGTDSSRAIQYQYLHSDPNPPLFDSITPPNFADFPDSVAAWLAPGRFRLPFEQIELLSDQSARIRRGPGGPDTVVSARRKDNNLGSDYVVYFQTDTGQDSLWMNISQFTGTPKITVPAYIFQYSYRPFQPPFQFVHSPVGKFYLPYSTTPWTYLSLFEGFNNNTDTAAVKRVDMEYQ